MGCRARGLSPPHTPRAPRVQGRGFLPAASQHLLLTVERRESWGGCFPHTPRETVSSATVCSYSRSLWTFAAPRASSSEPCARRLPSQRSSLPTREATRGTALAQRNRENQGKVVISSGFPHLDGGPARKGGQPLFPLWRDGGEGCSRSPTSAAPAAAFGFDGEVRGSTPGPLCFKSSKKVFSEIEQNSSSSPNSLPNSTIALTKMSLLLLCSKTTGLNPMPELVPASPRMLLRDAIPAARGLAPSHVCCPLPGKQSPAGFWGRRRVSPLCFWGCSALGGGRGASAEAHLGLNSLLGLGPSVWKHPVLAAVRVIFKSG